MSSITNKDFSVIFQKSRAFVKRKDDSIMLMGRNQLYVVDEKMDRAMLAEKEANKKLLKLHQRYGHININDSRK